MFYYINNNPDEKGNYEVHESNCYWISIAKSKDFLGFFNSCKEAVRYAKSKYSDKKIDGCGHCCRSCHMR